MDNSQWQTILPTSLPTLAATKARRAAICSLAIDASKLWPIDYVLEKYGDDVVWPVLLHGEQTGEVLSTEALDLARKVCGKMLRRKHLPTPPTPDGKLYRLAVRVVDAALFALLSGSAYVQMRCVNNAMNYAEKCGVSQDVLMELAFIATGQQQHALDEAKTMIEELLN